MLESVTKGGKSSTKLDELNDKLIRHGGELAAIDVALEHARRMVADLRQEAQAAEVEQANRAAAERAAKISATIATRLARVDDHFAHAFGELKGVIAAIDDLHAAGFDHPSANSFRVNSILCLKTVIGLLPRAWRLDMAERIEVAPHERKTFTSYWNAVQTSIDRQIAPRLAEPEKVEAKRRDTVAA